MTLRPILICTALTLSLSGCLENNTQRGIAGAAGGAVIASAVGGSVVTGAVIGGAAGALCKDAGVKACRNK